MGQSLNRRLPETGQSTFNVVSCLPIERANALSTQATDHEIMHVRMLRHRQFISEAASQGTGQMRVKPLCTAVILMIAQQPVAHSPWDTT